MPHRCEGPVPCPQALGVAAVDDEVAARLGKRRREAPPQPLAGGAYDRLLSANAEIHLQIPGWGRNLSLPRGLPQGW